jgi:hypothetical protein
MNIFMVDKDPIIAAKMLCDRHVCKMIIESAQMLSTAHRVLDGEMFISKTASNRNIKRYKHNDPIYNDVLYHASFINHPCTKWVMESNSNYDWLYQHMIELNSEFKLRYNHENDHLTIQKLGLILEKRPKSIPNVNKITKLKPCMPDHCVISNDTINSYRNYYKLEKRGFATWKQPAEIPYWY